MKRIIYLLLLAAVSLSSHAGHPLQHIGYRQFWLNATESAEADYRRLIEASAKDPKRKMLVPKINENREMLRSLRNAVHSAPDPSAEQIKQLIASFQEFRNGINRLLELEGPFTSTESTMVLGPIDYAAGETIELLRLHK